MFSISEKTIEIIITSMCFHLFFVGMLTGLFLLFYLFTTRYWWCAIVYLLWLYYDRKTGERGGRPLYWLTKLKTFEYYKNYFPSNLITPSDFTLDSERNYIICCFPHGILPIGVFNNILVRISDFRRRFPKLEVRIAALPWLLFIPFMRDYNLAVGVISCSINSLNYFLNSSKEGHVLVLMPGGAAEAYNARPGQYKFIVKKRKGFVKLALRNGTCLIPSITFGENDVFYQIENPKIRGLQKFIRDKFGFAVPLFYGRGFKENSYGLIPRKKPLTTVLGTPIDVAKVENPSNEQVNELHEKFLQELVKLFDAYKHEYLENASDSCLVLE